MLPDKIAQRTHTSTHAVVLLIVAAGKTNFAEQPSDSHTQTTHHHTANE